MGKEYRKYREGCTHHVYCKGVDGNVIFYSKQDCIYYITLFYHLSRRYGITIRAFCIMPNHVHSNEQAPSRKDFFEFHRVLNRDFTRTYNKEHGRTGPIFMKPFGFAPKTVGKRIRENIAYIINNAKVGRLAQDIDQYKWNLMPYRNSDHPFSAELVKRKASNPLRRSLAMLKYYYDRNMPLTYDRQRVLLKKLKPDEAMQLTDYILSIHNCLDYEAIGSLYMNDVENAVTTARNNSGSEHDIPEDFEDYRIYNRMMKLALESGVDLQRCNFEGMPKKEIERLKEQFRLARFPVKQIRKFLHLGPGNLDRSDFANRGDFAGCGDFAGSGDSADRGAENADNQLVKYFNTPNFKGY